MDELIKELGISGELIDSDNNTKTLDIEGSNNYGKVYSKLDNSDLVEEDENSSQVTEDTSSIQFDNDDYILTLLANFDTDEYKLIVKKK